MRVNALEEKLEETRAERGHLANYRQVAAELEAANIRLEDEVVATAQIATGANMCPCRKKSSPCVQKTVLLLEKATKRRKRGRAQSFLSLLQRE